MDDALYDRYLELKKLQHENGGKLPVKSKGQDNRAYEDLRRILWFPESTPNILWTEVEDIVGKTTKSKKGKEPVQYTTVMIARRSEVENIIRKFHYIEAPKPGEKRKLDTPGRKCSGYEATYASIQRQYLTGTKLKGGIRRDQDVRAWILKNCDVCQVQRATLSNKVPRKAIKVNKFGDWILMDLKDHRHEPHNGNHYMLVFFDHYSKASWLYPIPQKSADWVFRCMLHLITKCHVPCPAMCSAVSTGVFAHDNGTEFCNEIIKKLQMHFGYKVFKGPPYDPNVQGAIERFNRTYGESLKKYGQKYNEQGLPLPWSDQEFVAEIEYGYNTQKSRTTGLSPFELERGQRYKVSAPLQDPKQVHAISNISSDGEIVGEEADIFNQFHPNFPTVDAEEIRDQIDEYALKYKSRNEAKIERLGADIKTDIFGLHQEVVVKVPKPDKDKKVDWTNFFKSKGQGRQTMKVKGIVTRIYRGPDMARTNHYDIRVKDVSYPQKDITMLKSEFITRLRDETIDQLGSVKRFSAEQIEDKVISIMDKLVEMIGPERPTTEYFREFYKLVIENAPEFRLPDGVINNYLDLGIRRAFYSNRDKYPNHWASKGYDLPTMREAQEHYDKILRETNWEELETDDSTVASSDEDEGVFFIHK